jgi:hypothetical protein
LFINVRIGECNGYGYYKGCAFASFLLYRERDYTNNLTMIAWEEARRCLPVIRALADKPGRTRKGVEEAAARFGYDPPLVLV